MPIDRAAADTFLFSCARLLDRHRHALLFGDGGPEPVLAALRAYRNPDGGFGHALEPDLRGPESQPAPTLYALEILGEAGAAEDQMTKDALAWVASISEPDGGIPFVLPGFEDHPHTFWWTPQPGSFLTLGLAATLHGHGVHDSPWLSVATDWCWNAIEANEAPSGYGLKYACAFLDAAPDAARAEAAVATLAERVAGTDAIALDAGAEGEALRPLDLSPRPGTRSRALVGQDAVDAHLDAVEAGQREDGGWMFDWLAWSPAQTADWRGIVTLRALLWLRWNGRL
jgi:hypothetical protein